MRYLIIATLINVVGILSQSYCGLRLLEGLRRAQSSSLSDLACDVGFILALAFIPVYFPINENNTRASIALYLVTSSVFLLCRAKIRDQKNSQGQNGVE